MAKARGFPSAVAVPKLNTIGTNDLAGSFGEKNPELLFLSLSVLANFTLSRPLLSVCYDHFCLKRLSRLPIAKLQAASERPALTPPGY